MGRKRYYCSHCDDFVSQSTRSRHLKQLAERKESVSEAESDSISDVETSSEVHSSEIRDTFNVHEECFNADLASGDCGCSISEGETYKLSIVTCGVRKGFSDLYYYFSLYN